jgi:hypothetical protein
MQISVQKYLSVNLQWRPPIVMNVSVIIWSMLSVFKRPDHLSQTCWKKYDNCDHIHKHLVIVISLSKNQ